MSSFKAPRLVRDALPHTGAWAKLRRELARTQQLQQIVDHALPAALVAQVTVGAQEETVLWLLIGSNSVAARTRLLLPTLLRQLQASEPGLTALKIRLQPQWVPPVPRPSSRAVAHLSPATVALFHQLSLELKPSRLRSALEHLVNSRRG